MTTASAVSKIARIGALLLSACALGACVPSPPPATAEAPPDLARPASGKASDHAARLLSEGRPELAHKAYRIALLQEGPELDVLLGLGVSARQIGRLRQARTFLAQAVAEHPMSLAARNNLGVVLYDMHAFEDAEVQFGAARRIAEAASPDGSPAGSDAARLMTNIGIVETAKGAVDPDAPLWVPEAAPTHEIVPVGGGKFLLLKTEEAEG